VAKVPLTVGTQAPNADDIELRLADGAFLRAADVEAAVRRLLDQVREHFQRTGRVV
jgi:hypothetical protein